MRVELKTPPMADHARALREAAALFGTPRPLLNAWGVAMLKEIHENFRVGGRPPWKPLAPSTVAARRQGKGDGTARPLQNTRAMERGWNVGNMRIDDRSVTVFNNDPKAAFHEFGTRGPYEIKPKNAKALALPFFPERDVPRGLTGPGGNVKPGRYSLAGLGRSTRTKGGKIVYRPAGAKASKRFAGREGKTVSPYTNIAFYKGVIHPGIAARPVLPRREQIIPVLDKTADAFIIRALFKRAAERGGGAHD